MKLKGSCHCGAVRFSLESETPYPYMWCYCTICRKTAGGGGYAINIMGQAGTLKSKGRTKVYRATRGGGERHFCGKCAAALWLWDKRWPEWIYPFASAIDTPLPKPKERQLIFLDSKPGWAQLAEGTAVQGLSQGSDHRLASQARVAHAVTQWLARLDPSVLVAGIAVIGFAALAALFSRVGPPVAARAARPRNPAVSRWGRACPDNGGGRAGRR